MVAKFYLSFTAPPRKRITMRKTAAEDIQFPPSLSTSRPECVGVVACCLGVVGCGDPAPLHGAGCVSRPHTPAGCAARRRLWGCVARAHVRGCLVCVKGGVVGVAHLLRVLVEAVAGGRRWTWLGCAALVQRVCVEGWERGGGGDAKGRVGWLRWGGWVDSEVGEVVV